MKAKRRLLWPQVFLLAALLLSAALRFYRLDAQSFWNDEGNSARLAERSIKLIIEGAAGDVHPPGYYLLLRVWRGLTGSSEFSLRSLSAFCGILTVAVTAAVGRKVGGVSTAVGGALALAVHPLAVYYSQEARMYALLGLLAAATLLIAARLQRRSVADWPAAGALLLVLIAGLYTHYAYAFVVLSANVVFVATWLLLRPLRWRRLLIWASCHLLAALAFLPWLPNVLRAAGGKAGAATFCADVGKGALAAFLGGVIFGGTVAASGTVTFDLHGAQAVGAVAAIIGHNWPVFLKFKLHFLFCNISLDF